MSKVFTMAALQSRSDCELQSLMQKVQRDLVHSTPGSTERSNALANLENIVRALSFRQFQP